MKHMARFDFEAFSFLINAKQKIMIHTAHSAPGAEYQYIIDLSVLP